MKLAMWVKLAVRSFAVCAVLALLYGDSSFGAPPVVRSKAGAAKPVKPFLPGNRLPAIGDLGQLFARRAKVVQVVDANNAIVELEWYLETVRHESFNNGTSRGQSTHRTSTLKHEPVWIIFATERMVVGQLFESDRLFEIRGTREVEQNGVKRAMLVLELVDEERIRSEGYRMWLSADGLLAMVARLQEVTGAKKERLVTLIRRDDTTITVPLPFLSRADQDFIQENPVALPVAAVPVAAVPNAGPPGPGLISAPKNPEDPVNRFKWYNETDDTTLRQVKDKAWEEVDNQTGQVKFALEETNRNDDFVELLCPKRKTSFRLLANRLDQKKAEAWFRVADGKWARLSELKDGKQ